MSDNEEMVPLSEYLGLQAMLAYALHTLGGTMVISQEDLYEGQFNGKTIMVVPRDETFEIEVNLVDDYKPE